MKKEKIAYVVQRYGLEVNGGSEYACRELSEHLIEKYDVHVITTCARGVSPWDNYYPEGITEINGVTVRRFPVERVKDQDRLREVEDQMNAGEAEAEKRWVEEVGPYVPKLVDYLRDNGLSYKVVMFETYNFYPTIMGLRLGLKNSIVVPTAHDEPNIYRKVYRETIPLAKGILYNSIEEREFLIRNFGTKDIPGRITCVGIREHEIEDWSVPEKYKQYSNYVIYVGRVANGKNFRELNKYFLQYKKRNSGDLKLLIIGRTNNDMLITHHEDIIFCDFVSEEDKMCLMKNAKFLIMPSLYESLSLVILESMLVERPVLVNGKCEVLKGQCIRSNAGLYYSNYAEFEGCMNYMLKNEAVCNEMGRNGRKFVQDNYNWDYVVKNVCELIEEIGVNTGYENSI